MKIARDNETTVQCRGVSDTASTRNFIVEELATVLKLPRKTWVTPIGGLNGSRVVTQLSGYEEPDLVMQKTLFGWVIGGKIPIYPNKLKGSKCFLNRTTASDDISRFWEMDDIEPMKHLSSEETMCEERFKKTIARDGSGRFVAALPFNEQCQDLGESYFMALKRLTSLGRRFIKKPGI